MNNILSYRGVHDSEALQTELAKLGAHGFLRKNATCHNSRESPMVSHGIVEPKPPSPSYPAPRLSSSTATAAGFYGRQRLHCPPGNGLRPSRPLCCLPSRSHPTRPRWRREFARLSFVCPPCAATPSSRNLPLPPPPAPPPTMRRSWLRKSTSSLLLGCASSLAHPSAPWRAARDHQCVLR